MVARKKLKKEPEESNQICEEIYDENIKSDQFYDDDYQNHGENTDLSQNFKGNYRDEETYDESNVDPFEFVETDVKQEALEDDAENLENSIISDIKQEPDYFEEYISDPKGIPNFTI